MTAILYSSQSNIYPSRKKKTRSNTDLQVLTMEVKLFAAPGSPFSCRVVLALKLKGVEYEYVRETLRNKSPLLLEYNPVYKRIPVLVHNGKPIVESLVILEYIDETWKGDPILPEDPYERSRARFWAKFIDDKCIPAIWKACWGKGHEASGYLKALEDELIGKTFFGGDAMGFVDIAAIYIAFWLELMEEMNGVVLVTREKFTRLCEWRDELLSVSIVKDILPSRDYVIRVFTALYGSS